MPRLPLNPMATSTCLQEMVRCFLHVVSEGLTPEVQAEIARELHEWEFSTPTLQAVVRPHVVNSLVESVEVAKQSLGTYPESMHLVVGMDLLNSERLREPLHGARQELGRGHLGVIQLSPSAPNSMEIDGVASISSLRSEVRRVFRKLHYQRTPQPRELPCPPQCQRISQRDEFEAALRLRYNVYHVMGYIPERFRSDKTGLEIDNLDKYSLHYAAYVPCEDEKNPAAILRLITQDMQEDSRRWVQETLSRNPDPKLVRSSKASEFQDMPVFQNMSALQGLQGFLQEDDCLYGELSRVIVGEAYRGLGLSRDLIQFALADAYQLGLRCLFLACIPDQVPMYAKHGFIPLDTEVVQFRRVRQPARAMYLFLDS